MATGILLSCEHGGNEVPPFYTSLFEGQKKVLDSHRGWDPGTLALGNWLSGQLSVPLFFSKITRLLIEINRSLDHDQLFSEFSNLLPHEEKEKLISHYYLPYRNAVHAGVREHIPNGKSCLHLSLHSFTPVWKGVERDTDIGLLFDPGREREASICCDLLQFLKGALPELCIQFNRPYLGTDDGLTTFMRTHFSDAMYAGVEIEINQKWVGTPVFDIISKAFLAAITHLQK